jgi:hypothetical protein
MSSFEASNPKEFADFKPKEKTDDEQTEPNQPADHGDVNETIKRSRHISLWLIAKGIPKQSCGFMKWTTSGL